MNSHTFSACQNCTNKQWGIVAYLSFCSLPASILIIVSTNHLTYHFEPLNLPLWRCKIVFIVKQTRNKTKKLKLLSMHNYSPPQSQYFVELPFAAITAAKSLGVCLYKLGILSQASSLKKDSYIASLIRTTVFSCANIIAKMFSKDQFAF